MFFYLLTVFMIIGIVQGQGERNCPHVSTLECFCDQSNTDRCNKQGFVRLSDGTYCTGCRVNLPVNSGQSGNSRCPPYRCHMLEYRPGCELLEQFAFVGLNLCPVCSVLYCPSEMPTVSI